MVSGVRSSCEAVETNERRATSWRRSASCMRASARARSPTSSRPSSFGAGASGPSAVIRSAAARSRARRRSSVLESATPSATATSMPTPAADDQGVADLVDGRRDLGQPALGDEHAVSARTAGVQPHRDRHLVALAGAMIVRSSRVAWSAASVASRWTGAKSVS